MIKKMLIAVFSLIVPLAASASTCQTWEFMRTPVGSSDERATWTFKEEKNSESMKGTGRSTFLNNSGYVLYDLVATVTKSNQVMVERSNSSDRNNCYYRGKKDGNKIEGTFICTAYTSSPLTWAAIVSKTKC